MMYSEHSNIVKNFNNLKKRNNLGFPLLCCYTESSSATIINDEDGTDRLSRNVGKQLPA
jgi:hypothetical protein